MSSHKGKICRVAANSMLEYLLPAALVGILFFTAAALFGNQFPTFLAGAMNSKTAAPVNAQVSVKALGSNPYIKDVEITLSDGTVLRLQEYPTILSKSIETIGSDGTTDLLAENLRMLALQLKEQGKITEAEANQLLELANQGHRMASIEALIDQFVEGSGNDLNKFLSSPVTFDGQVYANGFELSKLLQVTAGIDNPDYDPVVAQYIKGRFTPFDSQDAAKGYFEQYDAAGGPELNQFIRLFATADKSAAMQNPEIRMLVSKLSDQIVSIADSTSDKLAYAKDPEFKIPLSQVNAKQGSLLTTKDSSGICQAGGNVDQGYRCD